MERGSEDAFLLSEARTQHWHIDTGSYLRKGCNWI